MYRRQFLRAIVIGGSIPRLVAGGARGQQGAMTMAKAQYGVGILGNCCTHGAGLAGAFAGHPRTRLVTGYEPDLRRGPELGQAMGLPLAESYEAVVGHPEVDIVGVTTDPCDKAAMVEMACRAGKHILLNKPMCESFDSARRIEQTLRQSRVKCVFDISMVKGLAPYAKLRQEMAAGKYGRPIAYHHDFGMTFPPDFPIRDLWPERFDPPQVSGGGEMTNMGCYAIDYMVTLLGSPRSVQAKRGSFWQEYAESPAENFGQIICDYGDFYACLAVGKQKLTEPLQGVNDLSIRFHNTNLILNPYTDTCIVNGLSRPMAEYVGDTVPEGAIDQLLRCIEQDAEPQDNVELGRMGVEVLMGAYKSIVKHGAVVKLPLKDGSNPLLRVGRAPAHDRDPSALRASG